MDVNEKTEFALLKQEVIYLRDDVKSIKRGIAYVIALVIAAFVTGLAGLLWKGVH